MKKFALLAICILLLAPISYVDGFIFVRGTGSDVTPPEFSSASIGTDGETVTINFNENVTGTENDTFDLDCNGMAGSNVALAYSSGSGTSALVFTAASTVETGETCDLDFDGDPNEFEDDSGNDLADFSNESVTNNSTQTICEIASPSESCEDFEGSTLCDSGYSSNCQSTAWDVSGDNESGCTIDFDSTQNLASNSCVNKGSYWYDAYDASYSGASDDCRIYNDDDFSSIGTHYVSFVIYLDSVTGELTSDGDYISVAHGWSGSAFLWALLVANDSGTHKWILYDAENAVQNYSSTNHPTDGNAYEVQIKWDVSGNTQELKIDGTSVATNTQTITRTLAIMNLGAENSFVSGWDGGAFRAQYDNIQVDTSGYLDPCE